MSASLHAAGAQAMMPLALLVALAVDRLLGEPPARVHPVVWMGAWLRMAGKRLAGLRPFAAFTGGAVAWVLAALPLAWGAWCLQAQILRTFETWAAVLLLGLLLKPMLAWRMLCDEAMAVEDALAISLDAGRGRLSRLVSRDVTSLTETEVRESAIESLAENLNDSVVAPVFWFVLLGLPGAVVYRFANTADAMWGYRGERNGQDWEWAGKWAARTDDVLSWLPARITALLMALAGATLRSMGTIRREAARTPSPNSGWPMAAMAVLLGVRLSKSGVYVLNEGAGNAEVMHMSMAVRLSARAVWLLCVLVTAVLFLMPALPLGIHGR